MPSHHGFSRFLSLLSPQGNHKPIQQMYKFVALNGPVPLALTKMPGRPRDHFREQSQPAWAVTGCVGLVHSDVAGVAEQLEVAMTMLPRVVIVASTGSSSGR